MLFRSPSDDLCTPVMPIETGFRHYDLHTSTSASRLPSLKQPQTQIWGISSGMHIEVPTDGGTWVRKMHGLVSFDDVRLKL